MSAVVGPLPVIRFQDGTRQAYEPPRNTMDIRYAACKDHHPACDCREALLAEDIGEYRMMLHQVEQAIITATADHLVWAYDGAGWENPLAQCKCPLCKIRRDCHIGYGDAANAVLANNRAMAEAARERERAHRDAPAKPGHPGYIDCAIEEVPF